MSLKDTKFTYYSGRSPELVKTSYGTGTGSSTNSSTSNNSNNNNNNYTSLLTGPKSSSTSETGTAAVRPTVPDEQQLEQSRMTSRRTRAGSSAGSCVSARLCWSDEVHQVHTLAETFDGKFPVLARVERGYYSGTEHGLELSIGQVLQIYGARDETRIMLRSSEGQTFSVPFNFRLNVRPLLTSHQDSAQQLSKVAEESVILPVTVRVDSIDTDSLPYSNTTTSSGSSNSSSSSSRNNSQCSSLVRSTFPDQSQLTIESIYQSKFLVASPIQDDWLDTSKLLVIPSELQPQFTVAERLHGADSDVWNDYCGMFARSARQLRISDVTGYDGIVYTSWISQQRAVRRDVSTTSQTVNETDRELNFDRYKLTPPQDTRHCYQQQQQPHSHHHHQQQHHRVQIHHQSPVAKSPVVVSLASGRDVTTPVCQSLDCLNLVSSSTPFRRDVPAQSSCDSPCRKKNSNKTGSASGAAYCRRDELSMLPLKDLSKTRRQQHVKFPGDVLGQSSRVAETTLVAPVLPNTSASHFSGSNSSRGRSDVVVTSRNDVTCDATSSNRDFAVQVGLPQSTAFCISDLPPRSSSDPRPQTKNFPRMGKRCALPVGGGARKSSLGDVIADTTAAAGLSGSMPCLSAGGGCDVAMTSSAADRPPAVTQSVVNLPAASSKMVAGSSTSDCELNHSDEGYYTKDSSVSMSSGEMSFVRPTKHTRNIEPVFF